MILHLVVSTLLENDTIIYVLQIQNLVYNHTFTRIKSRIFFTIIINEGKWNSSGCLSRSRFTFNLKRGKRITFHEVGRQFVMATWSSTVSPKFWNGGIGAILAAGATPCRIAGTRRTTTTNPIATVLARSQQS